MTMPSLEAETDRVRKLYDDSAARYDRVMDFFERLLFHGGREWVCAHAVGDVLEIGIGTGRNLPHYAGAVRLTGIDLSPAMLELAGARARQLGRHVDLRSGDAQRLDFPDESFDTVVSTLTLCSVPNDARAVAEAKRVLRPGGRFVLLEHVRSPLLPVRAVQRILNPLAVRFQADHLTREPLDALNAAGFSIERLERLKWGLVERVAARKSQVPARAE